MNAVHDLPHDVREITHVEIEMSDGVRLAARIWLPGDAEHRPVPALLEYIPYRKRDGTAPRDARNHPYFAGHGYASVRVDLRGSGDSGGVLTDEYLDRELSDGEEVLAWLAAQPWCNGRVGMFGISWGGFNALQIAARRPPELGAVITVCSTDDRFADDVHFMGGCLLGDNLSWASTMFAYNSLPPDPELVGDRWRDMWRARLEGSGLWLDTWLRHQSRDAYWRWGSICEDFGAITCPVLAASGWADGYSNAVFRLLQGLEVPRQGLIGPWSHKYPHMGVPGPAVGFLQEAVRWWDRWLKDRTNRVMDEPMLRVFLQDSVSPFTSYAERPGRWVGVPSWPPDELHEERFGLAQRQLIRLEDGPPRPGAHDAPSRGQGSTDAPELRIRSPLSVGLYAGKWCSYSGAPDLPGDQRLEDGGSLVFDTPPLPEDVHVVGAPVARLRISSDQPAAMVAVRLSDVLPDGKVTRITYGLLNLTHRNGHATPEPLAPGRGYDIEVRLKGIAQRFPRGHQIRLAVSSSYFPLAWTPPAPATLGLAPSHSRLVLPTLEPGASLRPVSFAPPEAAPPLATTQVAPGEHAWRVHRDLAADASELEVVNDDGVVRFDDLGLELGAHARETYRVVEDDPTSATGETCWVRTLRRGDWSIETHTRTHLSCTPTAFRLEAELEAFEGSERVFRRAWREEIARLGV